MSMIEYHKMILSKISLVDASLFRKELRKAFACLDQEDREELKHWFRTQCICRIPERDPDILAIRIQIERS